MRICPDCGDKSLVMHETADETIRYCLNCGHESRATEHKPRPIVIRDEIASHQRKKQRRKVA